MNGQSRVTITTYGDMTIECAVTHVAKVIAGGRISTVRGKPCYCLCTVWDNNDVLTIVLADVTRTGGDSFRVYFDKKVDA